MTTVAQCTHDRLAKHGKDSRGKQRWRCSHCRATMTRDYNRPLGDMRIPMDKAEFALGLLLEGMSTRACERITHLKRDTICDLVLLAGENCDRLLEATVREVPSRHVEVDEIWSFVGCRHRHAVKRQVTNDKGHSWTWFAIDSESKLILSHKTGGHDSEICREFLDRLNNATCGHVQITADCQPLYTENVPDYFGDRCDFAQIIKSYSSYQSRYSCAMLSDIEKRIVWGSPDESRITTSAIERFNLTVRTHLKRFTRLTNGHSKSRRHHAAMVSLFVAFYNFCRLNTGTGKGCKAVTPAVAAGLADGTWSLVDLLTVAGSNHGSIIQPSHVAGQPDARP